MKQSGAILSVHVGAELKERWIGYCSQHDTTASAAVRATIRKLLAYAEREPRAVEIAHEQSDPTRYRIEVRLTGSELSIVRKHAETQGMSSNQWIVNLIRANLTAQPQFGMVELSVLGESNSRLLALGRNLNQIARAINTHFDATSQLKIEQIEALTRAINKHTELVTGIMRANIDRWVLK